MKKRNLKLGKKKEIRLVQVVVMPIVINEQGSERYDLIGIDKAGQVWIKSYCHWDRWEKLEMTIFNP